MAVMSESFVDLSYRGLALGKRIKLTQIRAQSGYLELPTPMPVGTTIGITTDDGVQLEATVAEIYEQVGGLDRPPGMLVRPLFASAANETWWTSRSDGAAAPAESAKAAKAPPPADADGKVTVTSRRMSGQAAVPELVDDGRNTAVMEVVDDSRIAAVATQAADANHREGNGADTIVADDPDDPAAPALVDDGKRTMAMDAVDLAALGLSASSSGQFAAVKPEDYADDTASGPVPTGDKPEAKSKKKRTKRR